jgi:hypothetical protein
MAEQVAAGVVVYGALAYAFDVVGLRSVIVPKVAARLRPPQVQEEG